MKSDPMMVFRILAAMMVHATAWAGGNVLNTSVGFTPLDDLGPGTYLGYAGGLYPGGLNQMPTAHHDAGVAKAASIQRLDASGNPSPTGKIVILTLGMSNGSQVFSKLGELMSGLWAPGVVFVNGAQGSIDAALWSDPNHAAWTNVQNFLANAGVTAAQVQVVLNFHAVAHASTPPQPWPATPEDLQGFQEAIAGHIVAKFPNVKMSWWGTREYGGYATSANNPEPYAYRSAFAVKWMIERQIQGAALNHDPSNGPVTAPWMAWGPYLWADGLNPREDGLVWEPRDFSSDGTHPNTRGRVKQAGPWARLIRTDPLFAAWAVSSGNLVPLAAVTFPQDNMAVAMNGPLAIEAFAQDDDGSIAKVDFYRNGVLIGTDTSAPYSCLWPSPSPGTYPVYVVATDNQGATRTSLTIQAKIEAPVTATTLANDSFESGDFLGGGGWTMSSWSTSGSASAVSSTASDGTWSAQLGSGASLARSLALSNTSDVMLEFDWRASLPTGATFVAEIQNGSWQTVFTRSANNQNTWVRASVPLGAYSGASTFGIRFRTTGTGAVAGVDNISINRTSAPPQSPSLSNSLQVQENGNVILRWSAAAGTTYSIRFSDTLSAWDTVHHLSASESADVLFIEPKQGARGFYTIEALGAAP